VKKPGPSERAIHLGIVTALRMLAKPDVVWWHTANERRTTAREGWNLKQMGVKAGVPDFIILSRDPWLVIFLEVKRPGGYLSPAQNDMAAALERAGFGVIVVRSVDEAISCLDKLGVILRVRAA
jgi:hypothetical protein